MTKATVSFVILGLLLPLRLAGEGKSASKGQSGAAQHQSTPVNREVLQPFLNESRTYLAKADFAAAAAVLRKGLALSPRDPGLLFNLAAVLVREGQKQEALAVLDALAERGLGFHPDADPAFAVLADLPGYKVLLEKITTHEPVVTHSQPAFTIKESDLFPEGIACDERRGDLYVSSILKRKVVKLARDGKTKDFTAEHQDGLFGVLGMKVDTSRNLLWVAATGGPEVAADNNRSGLFGFNLKDSKLYRKFILDAASPHNLNDLAIAANGDVFVTDTATGGIYHVSRGSERLSEFLPAGTLRAPNGIAMSDDGRFLYVASSGRGISAIDVGSRRITDVMAPEGVVTLGFDGLYFYRGSLVGVQNGIGPGRVLRLFLRSPTVISRAELLENRNPLFDVPTTGAFCGRNFYYMANTQLGHTDAEGALKSDATLKPIVILKMEL